MNNKKQSAVLHNQQFGIKLWNKWNSSMVDKERAVFRRLSKETQEAIRNVVMSGKKYQGYTLHQIFMELIDRGLDERGQTTDS